LRRDLEGALMDAQGAVAMAGVFEHRPEISQRLQVLGVVGVRVIVVCGAPFGKSGAANNLRITRVGPDGGAV
jgi:hypothetical protein